MQYYFISEFPAVIKINGVYGGKIDRATKKFDLLDNAFIEVCPLNRTEHPINFMLNSNFLNSPPDGIIITDLKGAYVINFMCLCSLAPFSIITQQKFPFAVVTVFRENGLKLSIETPCDFYAQTLFIPDCQAVISPFTLDNKQFVAVHFLGKNNLLICFLIEDKITNVFSKSIDEVCFDSGLKTTHKFLDIAKHKLMVEWEFVENRLSAKNSLIERDENYKIEALSPNIIPYAFLEELLLGGIVDEFLSPDLKKNANHLKGFFGEYIGVFTPPDFRNIDEVGLVFCQNQNKYYANYFSFDVQDNKICNIKRSDN